ncbi:hypothetical protein RSOLAG22IIIB_12863 [Rhizoctonia solani]|uniref:Transmembrane protein n=1 Tax=Rhizoctonia solani TaxID=456999 RepID=A0A0K6GH60_9AGAM|nr:hypothetical protein RSOLAG22IIIB_12863 [Rhizoctonia solani]
MSRLLSLEYNLSHPHPKGGWFLLATFIIFLPALPALILVNFVTLGFELVPTLQPTFQPGDTPLGGWQGMQRLPRLLRPKPPRCQPKELARGDTFRLSTSMFDWTVVNIWDSCNGTQGFEQEQKNVEYRGQAFTNCSVYSAQLFYHKVDETQSVDIAVICPGSLEYRACVSMQTTFMASRLLSTDFFTRYYVPGTVFEFSNSTSTSSSYRDFVLAALDMLSTDSIAILNGNHLSNPAVGIQATFLPDPDMALLPDRTVASSLTYANGTRPLDYPEEGLIYTNSVYKLVYVLLDAVNFELGNHRAPNMFGNVSRLHEVIYNNRPPPGINSTDWVGDTPSIRYGKLSPPFQSWAEMLLSGKPVGLENATRPEDELSMITTYLCPIYQLKPMNSLLTSLFVGSTTMILSAWGAWMFCTAFLAKKIMPPRVRCECGDCQKRRVEEEKARNETPSPVKSGMLTTLTGVFRRTKPASISDDPENLSEQGQFLHQEYGGTAGRPTDLLDARHVSYLSNSVTEEK